MHLVNYQILWNNIENFQDPKNNEANKYLDYLLEQDFNLSKSGKVPILFWYCVGKSKK